MKAIQVILILALLLCLFPMPYGYFILVRYLATVVFTIMAYHHYKQQNNTTTYLWVCLALLFQPFFKITLGARNLECSRYSCCYHTSHNIVERKESN